MQFDRKITISAGSSRRAMVWQAQTLLISELWAKLQTPARGTEPLAEYLELPDFIQHEVPVLLDAKARRAYDQFERDLLLEVDEATITEAFLDFITAMARSDAVYSKEETMEMIRRAMASVV